MHLEGEQTKYLTLRETLPESEDYKVKCDNKRPRVEVKMLEILLMI